MYNINKLNEFKRGKDMGYTIRIGNATQNNEVTKEDAADWDGDLNQAFRPTVKEVCLEKAPHDGSPTDYTNSRWPSYSGWTNFCDDTGLKGVFYNEDTGLLREHPGCFLLTQDHLDQIKAVAADVPDDIQKGRYEWLVFWVEWALTNCDIPAIYNS